jgi:site-specific DNA-methyltransferase (adenine-specific)
VIDFFAHSGSTLLAAERLNRRCFTMDHDPIFCEITIRRLEHYRQTGRTGWQNSHPFETELLTDKNGPQMHTDKKIVDGR